MRIIKNNYNKKFIVECPICKSIFEYDDKEDIYIRMYEFMLNCPCCKERQPLKKYKEIKEKADGEN